MKIEFTQATFVKGDFCDQGTVIEINGREGQDLINMGRAKEFKDAELPEPNDRSIGLEDAPEAPEFTTRKGRFAKK